ncbi:hypothetical protein [Mesorhizobium caraganae]
MRRPKTVANQRRTSSSARLRWAPEGGQMRWAKAKAVTLGA